MRLFIVSLSTPPPHRVHILIELYYKGGNTLHGCDAPLQNLTALLLIIVHNWMVYKSVYIYTLLIIEIHTCISGEMYRWDWIAAQDIWMDGWMGVWRMGGYKVETRGLYLGVMNSTFLCESNIKSFYHLWAEVNITHILNVYRRRLESCCCCCRSLCLMFSRCCCINFTDIMMFFN